MPTFLAYGFGPNSHMGMFFSKNVGPTCPQNFQMCPNISEIHENTFTLVRISPESHILNVFDCISTVSYIVYIISYMLFHFYIFEESNLLTSLTYLVVCTFVFFWAGLAKTCP